MRLTRFNFVAFVVVGSVGYNVYAMTLFPVGSLSWIAAVLLTIALLGGLLAEFFAEFPTKRPRRWGRERDDRAE